MKNVLVWFEIQVKDLDRASKFYSDVLGLSLTPVEFGAHKMAFFPSESGSGSGALVLTAEHHPEHSSTVVYFDAGEDLTGALARVPTAGGGVAVPKTFISPEHGYFAHILDTEGNKVGLWSPK